MTPFTVTSGDRVTSFDERMAAVEAAKLTSSKTFRVVRVEGDGGKMHMEFRRGSLMHYVRRTH